MELRARKTVSRCRLKSGPFTLVTTKYVGSWMFWVASVAVAELISFLHLANPFRQEKVISFSPPP